MEPLIERPAVFIGCALAKVFHIRGVAVDGEYGIFHGSPMDLGVMGEYLMTQKYSTKIVNYILKSFDSKEGGTFLAYPVNAHDRYM